jgi:hypothetical protein
MMTCQLIGQDTTNGIPDADDSVIAGRYYHSILDKGSGKRFKEDVRIPNNHEIELQISTGIQNKDAGAKTSPQLPTWTKSIQNGIMIGRGESAFVL